MTRTLTFWLATCTIALVTVPARAEPVPPPPATTSGFMISWPSWSGWGEKDSNCKNLCERDPYSQGMWSIQFMSGYSLKTSSGSKNSSIDYTPQSFRLGYVLNTPGADNGCWHRGC